MKMLENSEDIQTGLYVYQYKKTIDGAEYTMRELYSTDGYCFYDLEAPENYEYDENTGERGDLKPESERVYYTWAKLAIGMTEWTKEQLNARFISVPIKEAYQVLYK